MMLDTLGSMNNMNMNNISIIRIYYKISRDIS